MDADILVPKNDMASRQHKNQSASYACGEIYFPRLKAALEYLRNALRNT
jgi:hypothetical protein